MTYTDTLTTHAEGTADRVEAVIADYEAGTLDRETTVAVIATLIARANVKAAALADLGLSADLTVAVGKAVPTVGVGAPPGDAARLGKAAGTLLDALPDTADRPARVRRLGRSEPLTTAANARGEAITKQPLVQGWTRNLSANPCELCVWWSREGRVWPKDHKLVTHKGCTCTQTPVLVESVRRVQR